MKKSISGRIVVRVNQSQNQNPQGADMLDVVRVAKRHDAIHTYLCTRLDETINKVWDSGNLRFRRLGELLGKGERALGIVIEDTFEFIEFVDEHGKSSVTQAERDEIEQRLEQEHLDELEAKLLG